ncbi:OLC1v1021887C1 [Oldenlandia corymbosa var. corymbosa]|uniref:OLC1v1021887C1 n=1 Tax=Oldenlandia corymbosa var. corymbosa TaxID=529605 RepID=A0AAV1BWP4_OLDCO|nr:OLC1v1021887C1 [Oldenlandia corymbosa var. corymbosa]
MNIPSLTKWACLLLISLTIFSSCHAKELQPSSVSETFNNFLNVTIQWRNHQRLKSQDFKMEFNLPIMLAGALSFVAASISSAGGIGGGGLFIPILTIVAGLDLKTASSFSAFMVTGGSIANVTFKSGISYWRRESECKMMNRSKNGGCPQKKMENGDMALEKLEEPLLHKGGKGGGFKVDVPWMKMGLLIVIWFCFFLLYLLRGNRYGQGIISIKPCGGEYWIISATQIPLAIIFTACILYGRKTRQDQVHEQELESGNRNEGGPDKFLFPVMALLAGGLGGVFGIGGGMLISPLLLQVGITPEITAATCSFMVFFSSTMSACEYLLLGMDHVHSAIIFSVICFLASLIGLIVVQRAIVKHGRASLIVFSVGIVMAASTILITSFGALDVWRDYTAGKYMGFKMPC